MPSKKFILVYQAGIANLFEVDGFEPYPESRINQRVYQGDFRTAEAMARGMLMAGTSVRVASCNYAGDCSMIKWTPGVGACPFRDKANPPSTVQS